MGLVCVGVVVSIVFLISCGIREEEGRLEGHGSSALRRLVGDQRAGPSRVMLELLLEGARGQRECLDRSGLGWVGLGCVRVGLVGLGCVRVGLVDLGCVRVGLVGLGCVRVCQGWGDLVL